MEALSLNLERTLRSTDSPEQYNSFMYREPSDDRKRRRYVAYALCLIAVVFLLFYVPWKDSSGEDQNRQGFLGYDWRSNQPHGTRYVERSAADIIDPLSLTKFQRAQVQAMLANKPTADLRDILGDSLSSGD